MSTAETLLTEHLDTWSSAIKARSSAGRGSSKKQEFYGIKKLRELILELAVRGLLVEQDPEDEPALELLKKIVSEKAKLVKDGEIKEGKKTQPTEKAFPFEIPSNWAWTRLGEISEIGPRNTLADDLEVGFVPMPLVSTDYDGAHGQEIKTWREIKTGYTHFANGDIAIAKITPCFENSKAAIFSNLKNGYGAGTTELHIARLIGKFVNARFLLLYLKSPMFLEKGKQKMTGSAGQKRVPASYFAGAPLPLPPLAEQNQIVAKVDELMALCDQLEQQQEDSARTHGTLVQTVLGTLTAASERGQFQAAWQRIEANFDTLFTTESSIDQLKQTVLQLAVMGKLVEQDPKDEPVSKLFGRITAEKVNLIESGEIKKSKALTGVSAEEMPYQLPPTWGWHRLNNLTSVLGDGIHGTPEYDPGGQYYFINGNNLNDGTIDIKSETKRVSQKEYEEHKKPLGETTVLVSINGTIGRVAFYGNEKVVLGKSACYFNLLGSISLQYIKIFIQTDFFLIYALREATGSTIQNVSLRAMRELPVPLPPLAEQKRIVAKVDELMTLCDSLKASLQSAQSTQLNLADGLVEAAIH